MATRRASRASADLRRRGITDRDIARAVGVHPATGRHWLLRSRLPGGKNRGKMSLYFGTPAHWWDEDEPIEDAA